MVVYIDLIFAANLLIDGVPAVADKLAGEAQGILVAPDSLSAGGCTLCRHDVRTGAVLSVYLSHQIRVIGFDDLDNLWI